MKHRISHKKYNGHRVYRNIQYIRQVYLQQSIGGTISAIPMSGYDGTDVNLSNTADIGYSFDSYNITGANLTGNTFKFNKSDVTASPNWTHNVYNLTLETDNNGKLESNKNTGYYNDTATLTATPSSNYQFSGYTVTGGSINNNIFTWSDSNATVKAWFKQTIDPYNPLGLPPFTIRVRCKEGQVVIVNSAKAVQISQSPNIWDVTRESNSWYKLFEGHREIIEVLGANTRGVDWMYSLFYDCTALTTVPLFDTSNISSMQGMFCGCYSLSSVPLFDTHNIDSMYRTFENCYSLSSVPLFDTHNVGGMYRTFENCSSLTSIPLFDTHKVRNMDLAFAGCLNVQTGALALYRQAASQQHPPGGHQHTFYNCGINTQTGSAELAQIPSGWK